MEWTPADQGIAAGKREAALFGHLRRNPHLEPFAHLDAALAEASVQCHASVDGRAVIYYTTDETVADPASGEMYIVFRGDQVARHHLKDNWKACYTVVAGDES
jgi:hypothetical protein